MITAINLQPKPFVRNGRTMTYRTEDEYNADIEPGQSIRVYGRYANRPDTPKPFDRTFRIGDQAEYGSYNISYYGTITAIGAKTITIQEIDKSNHRLDLFEFCRRNWNFDLAKTIKENATWMD